ncbi:MAG: DUF1501 domain-containing protein [Planctomycetaceae bacterium]|nr:DUF1501 domain-containing protein [Planctomycetaceae bacterium]
MLKIFSSPQSGRRFCDGVSRRSFLQVGGLAMGGATLPQLLAAEEKAGVGKSHKAVIMIYLCGGPPPQDMYDIRVDAPKEVRGEFNPIPTAVPGIEISEHLPMMAGMMDKLVPIRSIADAEGAHASHQCLTGHRLRPVPGGGWPEIGAVASKFQGPVEQGMPPSVSLCYTTQHKPYNEPGPGFLGLGNSSFRPKGPGRDDLILQGITLDRLSDRKQLLRSVDRLRREVDTTGAMDGMDIFSQRAFGILTSSGLFDALDLSKQDPKVLKRYGTGDEKRPKGDGAPRVPQNFLLARRLVEAGARVVTINYSFWDFHGQNFKNAKSELPVFDQALSALVEDLHERGMDKDVTVVAWGEFGRTPKINKNAGRDHWNRVSCALLAGGGMRTGQVIGATDRLGGEPVERPVKIQEVYATIYKNLGIDLGSQRLFDFRGRPQNLIEPGTQPLHELI